MNTKKWMTISMTALLVAAFALVCGSPASAQQAPSAPNEAALIEVLKGEGGWLEKQAACRQLRQIGTAASVPALAALLPDEHLGHMARFAFEEMPYPEVDQALRDALGATSGMPKVGVIISIGVRRDAKAVPALLPLLKDANADIARAAAGALGRIATPETADALVAFKGAAPEAIREALFEAVLAAGQGLVHDGNADVAVRVYEGVLASDAPAYVRMGAFRGLAAAQPAQAPERLIAALGGQDALFRDLAAQIVAETSGADTTALYAAALPKLPAGGQVALVRGLGIRNDPAARPAVVAAVANPDKQVKLAAINALAILGNSAEDVNTLVGVLASDDKEVTEAGRIALVALVGDAINPAAAAAVPAAVPGVRAQLLDVLATRRANEAMPLATQAMNDADAGVRVAALNAIGLVGGTAEAPLVVATLVKTADSAERSAADKALGDIGSRKGGEVLPLILNAMKDAGVEQRVLLVRGAARIGGADALNAVVASMGDPDAKVSTEALRLLSEWPTLDAAPHLAKLAQSADLKQQVLGLRGYVRLAQTEPDAGKKAAMLTEAGALTKRPEEKKLVIAAWGTLAAPQSFGALLPYLDDAAVKNEAGLAVVAVATELVKNETTKPQAVEALKVVIEKCEDAGIRDSAQKALGN